MLSFRRRRQSPSKQKQLGQQIPESTTCSNTEEDHLLSIRVTASSLEAKEHQKERKKLSNTNNGIIGTNEISNNGKKWSTLQSDDDRGGSDHHENQARLESTLHSPLSSFIKSTPLHHLNGEATVAPSLFETVNCSTKSEIPLISEEQKTKTQTEDLKDEDGNSVNSFGLSRLNPVMHSNSNGMKAYVEEDYQWQSKRTIAATADVNVKNTTRAVLPSANDTALASHFETQFGDDTIRSIHNEGSLSLNRKLSVTNLTVIPTPTPSTATIPPFAANLSYHSLRGLSQEVNKKTNNNTEVTSVRMTPPINALHREIDLNSSNIPVTVSGAKNSVLVHNSPFATQIIASAPMQMSSIQMQQQQHQQQDLNFFSTQLGMSSSAFSVPNHQPQPQPQQVPIISQQQQPVRRSILLKLCEENLSYEKDSRENKKRFFHKILNTKRAKSVPSDTVDKNKHPKGHEINKSLDDIDNLDQELPLLPPPRIIRRGVISVSWYEGTTTSELKAHVKKSVLRKLDLEPKMLLKNIRLIDESVEPHEEIVLSPYIPDRSSFLLMFTIKDVTEKSFQHVGAPDSPSAAPSPFPDRRELGELQREINVVLEKSAKKKAPPSPTYVPSTLHIDEKEGISLAHEHLESRSKFLPSSEDSEESNKSDQPMDTDMLAEHIESLFREKFGEGQYRTIVNKRRVVFTVANYFVLFLSVIAISAEIHERAPGWIDWIDKNVSSVQNCAADRDALFECISRGDFSGLVASVILWASQSVATKPIFLFGFESPQKLWIVVYEAGVTAVCWGTSYLCIRRGFNPDTRQNFLYKYWKDAVYGSLAGFNAAFMKAVLKNLIPQDQVLGAIEHRQLKIFQFVSALIGKSSQHA